MVIAISDVSEAQSLEVRPHDSEDLVKSNSETVWVDDTFNDMMACFATCATTRECSVGCFSTDLGGACA